MDIPHPVGVLGASKETIEAVHPQFLREGLMRARDNTIVALAEIRARLKVGMTEEDARKLALSVFAELGVSKHWHKPYIRFGSGTALTFHDPLQPDYRLRAGDPYSIDVGPVWAESARGLEYEGDYGDTFIFGENPEAELCARTARNLFGLAREKWKADGLTGAGLYQFLKCEASARGYQLVDKVDGHRLGDFPHHKYSKERLAGVAFVPSDSLWVLEVQVNDLGGRFGAFFEDLL